MGMLGYVFAAVCCVGVATEAWFTVRKRSKVPSPSDVTLSPLFIYIPVAVSAAVAFALKLAPGTRALGGITTLSPGMGLVGCAIIVLGLAIRWRAVATLGQQFTVDGRITPGHKLVETGLYGVVRHPSYLGALLEYVGVGVALENWISLLVMFLFPTIAQLYRISCEERVLLRHFGSAYRSYMRRTKKLIPGIF